MDTAQQDQVSDIWVQSVIGTPFVLVYASCWSSNNGNHLEEPKQSHCLMQRATNTTANFLAYIPQNIGAALVCPRLSKFCNHQENRFQAWYQIVCFLHQHHNHQENRNSIGLKLARSMIKHTGQRFRFGTDLTDPRATRPQLITSFVREQDAFKLAYVFVSEPSPSPRLLPNLDQLCASIFGRVDRTHLRKTILLYSQSSITAYMRELQEIKASNELSSVVTDPQLNESRTFFSISCKASLLFINVIIILGIVLRYYGTSPPEYTQFLILRT
jgi:hypothetical protein